MIYRLMITAELQWWRNDPDNSTVEGIIHNSVSPDFKDGDYHTILNYKIITYYPGFTTDVLQSEEHWVVQTQNNNYFILYKSQER
jgi:hypothetical protein